MSKPLLIDTFLYNGERELLDLRLCQLSPQVDHFIAVEGTMTFTGLPREVVPIQEPNVTHFIVDNFPEAKRPWKREHWQRNQILVPLKDYSPDTIVMVSDVDELPNLPEWADRKNWFGNKMDIGVFLQLWMQFSVTQVVQDVWQGTRICRLETLRHVYPQGIRDMHDFQIPAGGWHFSWMYDNDTKAKSYSHQELKDFGGTYAEQVQKKWNLKYRQLSDERHLPSCLQNQQWKYPTLLSAS